MITTLLEGNRRFVAETFEKEKELFVELTRGQKPTVLWIGCSDSRVPVNTITQTRAGEVFVHGEYWQARSTARIPTGAAVKVTALEGLVVKVEPQPPTEG